MIGHSYDLLISALNHQQKCMQIDNEIDRIIASSYGIRYISELEKLNQF